MVDSREIRRICNFCGTKFELTKNQMRQAKDKWPVNCSRSCARKAQHQRNYKHIRTEKECGICGEVFTTANWDSERTFCSNQCAATARFGDKDTSKTMERLERIIRDEAYMGYLKGISLKAAFKYGRDEEFAKEIVQEYFLALCNGHNTTIENVSKSMLRSEMKRGITGKRDCDFSFSTDEAMKYIKKQKMELSSIEFQEYVIDLYSGLNEFERNFITLYIKGFKDHEVMSLIRNKFPIGNERFYLEKKRLFKEIDYSKFGENYTSFKEY